MYFLSTNILGPKHLISKLNPQLLEKISIKTIFLFGCIFYFVLCITLYVIVPEDTWNEYKYYLYLLIVLDLAYFLYHYKQNNYLSHYLNLTQTKQTNNSESGLITAQNNAVNTNIFNPIIVSPVNNLIIPPSISLTSDLQSSSNFITNTDESSNIGTPHPNKFGKKKQVDLLTTTSSIFDWKNQSMDDYKVTHEVLSDQSEDISVFSSKSSSVA
jgi:hypothetical protein